MGWTPNFAGRAQPRQNLSSHAPFGLIVSMAHLSNIITYVVVNGLNDPDIDLVISEYYDFSTRQEQEGLSQIKYSPPSPILLALGLKSANLHFIQNRYQQIKWPRPWSLREANIFFEIALSPRTVLFQETPSVCFCKFTQYIHWKLWKMTSVRDLTEEARVDKLVSVVKQSGTKFVCFTNVSNDGNWIIAATDGCDLWRLEMDNDALEAHRDAHEVTTLDIFLARVR